MKRTAASVMILLAAAFAPTAGHAIADAAVVAQLVKNLSEMKQQYEKLQEQYETMQDQYRSLKALRADAEGHYGYGGLINGKGDLENREWSPPDWQSALQGLAGGNPARYKQLLAQYTAAHPALPAAEYEEGSSAENTEVYENTAAANSAAAVNSTYAFNTVQTHLQDVHTLSAQIDRTGNTKASLDLNPRLLAEIAYIEIQELKMQSVLNEQEAASTAAGLASDTEAAKFDRLPDQP